MQTRRWFNRALPQTLQIATFLLYAGGAFMLLFLVPGLWDRISSAMEESPPPLDRVTSVHVGLDNLFRGVGLHPPGLRLSDLGMLFLAGAHIAAGYGLANERKWSYPVALTCAGIAIALNLYAARLPIVKLDIFALISYIVLLAVLLHNQSRDYRRISFK